MERRNKCREIFPKFAYIPAVLVVVFNCLAFWGGKALTESSLHYSFSTPLDSAIPFLPCFMFFYILAYFQWLWGYIYHTRAGKDCYYHIVMCDLVAKMFCFIIFLLLPGEINRPEVLGDGFWDKVCRLIYSLDSPTALLPSIHCLESWLCFRAALLIKGAPRWYAPFQFVLTLFVFASTVFVKQHFLSDVFAGIAVVEIAWLLSKRFHLWNIFRKIEFPSVRAQGNNED